MLFHVILTVIVINVIIINLYLRQLRMWQSWNENCLLGIGGVLCSFCYTALYTT